MVRNSLVSQSSCTRYAAAFVACLGLAATPVSAQNAPPLPLPSEVRIADNNLTSSPVNGMSLGKMRIDFNRTTLLDVETTVLLGTIDHAGDAGESDYWLCYTVTRGGHSERLWIVSDGEMGGSDHEVTGAFATRLDPKSASKADCPELPRRFSSIELSNGLWLGDAANKVGSALRTTSRGSDGWWGYRYEGKTAIAVRGELVDFDVTSSVDVKLRRGLIVGINAKEILSD
jgi:hypothetical protein